MVGGRMADESKFDGEDFRRLYEADFSGVIEKYPYMFPMRDRLDLRKGWEPIFHRLCSALDGELTSEEKAIFHWRQVKQKFGGLRAYWGLHGRPCQPWGDVHVGGRQILTIRPKYGDVLQQRIAYLVVMAMEEASDTCERCGARPAGLDDTYGYRMTLCERHILERHEEARRASTK